MGPVAGELQGMRVLVVEDTLLVAEMIADMLQECGCQVVGPVARVDAALDLVRKTRLDGAVLDVNLAGTPSFAVAAALDARSVPYIFLSGYDPSATLPPEFQGVPRLTKPVDEDRLATVLSGHFCP